MPYSDNIITAPVSIYDVQRALSTSENDLGRLCRHANINRWSKMKPVPFPFIEPDRTQKVTAYNRQLWWWQGHPSYSIVSPGLVIGNYTTTANAAWITSCGIKFLGFSAAIDVLGAFNPVGNAYHTGDASPLANNFDYIPPAGGTAEPYRLPDYRYYKHNAQYNVIPDYGTETGTSRVLYDDPAIESVKCSIMSQAVSDTINSELSFNDLFETIGDAANFALITGKLSGTSFTVVSPSRTVTHSDAYFKEISLNLHDSQLLGATVIAIYCASITLNGTTYYVPLMQSTGDHPNTLIPSFPKRKIYNSWFIDSGTYRASEFAMKFNYGTGMAWYTNPFSALPTLGGSAIMNRIYMKLDLARTSSYTLTNAAITVVMSGQFLDSRGQMQIVNYELTSADTRFVLKNAEVDAYDWGSTETVYITSATSGQQTCYLAIYNLFANRHGVDTIYGGTIWRIQLFVSKNGQQSSIPDVEYGSMSDTDRLSIDVDPITA